ncbi:MAG: FAD-dependent oxidoreductase, partial [Sulfobacillus thermotolerans]|nr:FAD-dependent oxidoreductase [Sulfobacillus thermotolerans]
MGDVPDVLIVGGGVIGCALAYDLAASGLDVTVLEQE